ncbi:hypothetical protein [Phocaeicola vulgatus]|uniref:hypothetical protein n=1 Tax=Phocaeicola vulgatus TaxID=821 RepID=UPI001F237FAB|nr:hypothetical protein [Phocaeicola vulgatus]MCG0318401.1 hypothetical protein [Phocaeicola vulgatus]
MEESFLNGNSATFLATISTLAVLCFFGLKSEPEEKNDERKEQDNSKVTDKESEMSSKVSDNNFIRELLSLIARRALEFINRETNKIVRLNRDNNYEVISKAIAESDSSKNPYKAKMLDLANDLQFLTVNLQNEALIRSRNIQNFSNKITYKDLTEVLTSPFYSFMFCIIVLSADCIAGTNIWCINAIGILACLSTIYWGLIWFYYYNSIKNRQLSTKYAIVYEFKKKNYVRNIIFILGGYTLFCYACSFFNVLYIATYIWIPIVILYIIYLIIKFHRAKHACSIFTHYFNLVHLIFELIFITGICTIQYFFGCEPIFDDKFARISSVLFALCNGLIFPLIIPIIRLKKEINNTIHELEKLTKKYTEDNTKYKKELEDYFDIIYKIKGLSSSKKTES